MLITITRFAHGGETHANEALAQVHEISWFLQLPLFAIMVAVFAGIVWLLIKKPDVTALITSFALLVAGFGLFEVAPVVSAFAITAGLITTLGVTLLGLGSHEQS